MLPQMLDWVTPRELASCRGTDNFPTNRSSRLRIRFRKAWLSSNTPSLVKQAFNLFVKSSMLYSSSRPTMSSNSCCSSRTFRLTSITSRSAVNRSPNKGSLSNTSTRPPSSMNFPSSRATRVRNFLLIISTPEFSSRLIRSSARFDIACWRPADGFGGNSDGSIYSCHKLLKYSRRCKAIDTKDGTFSLLEGWEWNLTQFAKTRHMSKRTSLVVLYARRRIPRHTKPKSTGWEIILE
mmetsp:Transcript_5826/g.12127  ORF Transcript_5826/g.12127 Transcript_5826/m.12127 type:complete len:237 (-) Transcript_5826:738-1448(-)